MVLFKRFGCIAWMGIRIDWADGFVSGVSASIIPFDAAAVG